MLRFLLFLLLLAPSAADVSAQGLQRRVALSVGSYHFNDVGITPAPSVEFAADLFYLEPVLLTFGTAISWSRVGYGVEKEFADCNDCFPSYDYVGYGVGGQVYAELTAAPIPIRLSLGLVHYAGQVKYRPAGVGEIEPTDYMRRATSAELGLGLAWPLNRRFEIATDAMVYPRLGKRVVSGPDFSVTVGLGVRL